MMLINCRQRNIPVDENGFVGAVGICTVRPVVEFLSRFICSIAGSQDAGVAALLVGLSIRGCRILTGFQICDREPFRAAGEHRVQLHGRIQLRTGIEERAAGISPCGGGLASIGSLDRSHRFVVALCVGNGSAVGHFQIMGATACSNRDVDGRGNSLRFPNRVGSQAPGGHGCRRDEVGRALRVGKPSGKRIAFAGSLRCWRRSQGVYTLLILIGVNINC